MDLPYTPPADAMGPPIASSSPCRDQPQQRPTHVQEVQSRWSALSKLWSQLPLFQSRRVRSFSRLRSTSHQENVTQWTRLRVLYIRNRPTVRQRSEGTSSAHRRRTSRSLRIWIRTLDYGALLLAQLSLNFVHVPVNDVLNIHGRQVGVGGVHSTALIRATKELLFKSIRVCC